MNYDLEELFDDYKKACEFPANHIEDENKSVKWNKEFVEKNNKNHLEIPYEDFKTILEKQKVFLEGQKKRSMEINQFLVHTVDHIRKELNVSAKAAYRILGYAIEEGRSCGFRGILYIVSELIDIIKLCKEDNK